MKNISKLGCFLLLLLLLFPSIRTGTANNTPNYVGIGTSYTEFYIYNTAFDDDPYEDYLEDAGYSEGEIENITDSMFDDEFDKDVVQWKIIINEISEERESHDYDYVKVDYALDVKRENGQLGRIDSHIKQYLWEYDKDIYLHLAWYDWGLFFLFVANDVKWDKLAKEIDDEWGDDWDDDDEEASAEVESSWYYFTEKPNGISTSFNPDKDTYDDFESVSKYNEDGVLMYYEWTYDGDPIWKLELRHRFAHEYWWVFIVIAIAALVVVAILTFTIISRKKPMIIVLMGCVLIIIFLIIGQAFTIYQLYYFGAYS